MRLLTKIQFKYSFTSLINLDYPPVGPGNPGNTTPVTALNSLSKSSQDLVLGRTRGGERVAGRGAACSTPATLAIQKPYIRYAGREAGKEEAAHSVACGTSGSSGWRLKRRGPLAASAGLTLLTPPNATRTDEPTSFRWSIINDNVKLYENAQEKINRFKTIIQVVKQHTIETFWNMGKSKNRRTIELSK